MQLRAPNLRIADVETCDFGLMAPVDTETLLREAHSSDWRRYLESSSARRLLAELGVTRRHLTQIPGRPAAPGRLNAFSLARSAVARMMARRPAELAALDALIFVSTSNPNPCNSQAALLAGEFGLRASCFDLKAGCSGGVLGIVQAALLIGAGCRRVLVVMAENLSQLTSPDDLRMLLTVGDGAACVLLEAHEGPGFLAMLHGTEPALAHTMTVRTPFPPAEPGVRYVYEMEDTAVIRPFLADRWRALYHEGLAAARLDPTRLDHWFFHQTHGAQVDALRDELAGSRCRAPKVVDRFGNLGTPTFAVALAEGFSRLEPGDHYLIQAVGGGVSWAAIVAEHR
jgi:3-oxoacyl-[acyl-carrier-protein] synthase-3